MRTTETTQRRVVVRDGLELRVLQWGSPATHRGAPIVLVHGLASNAALWSGAARRLESLGHPVIAVDQRGHGASDKPDEGYDMATVADDLAGLLTTIEPEGWASPIVVGQSWGGNVIVEFAYRHPDASRGVVAVDGGFIQLADHFPDWESCAEALRPPSLLGTPAVKLRRWMRDAHPDWPEEGIDGAMANMEVLADGTVRPWLTLDRHMAILRGMWEHAPLQTLRQVTVPVLLVPAGGRSGAIGGERRDAVERAASAAARSAVEWFAPADHDLHAQQPDRFALVLHRHAESGVFS